MNKTVILLDKQVLKTIKGGGTCAFFDVGCMGGEALSKIVRDNANRNKNQKGLPKCPPSSQLPGAPACHL